jgi:hypothetical protein
MKATIDSEGRILLSKALGDSLGLTPGSEIDVSPSDTGVQITPGGRTATLRRAADGRLVAHSETEVTDEVMFALIDAGRR